MSGHTYGPHDPTTAPDAITVGRPGRHVYPPWEVRPLSPAVMRQRATINRLAHENSSRVPAGSPADAKLSPRDKARALIHPNVAALLAHTGGHPTRYGSDHGPVRRAAYRFRPGQPLTWSDRP
jgi:hypothetical protein